MTPPCLPLMPIRVGKTMPVSLPCGGGVSGWCGLGKGTRS